MMVNVRTSCWDLPDDDALDGIKKMNGGLHSEVCRVCSGRQRKNVVMF